MINLDIDWNSKTELCNIMKDSGSDKSTRHNYTVLYSNIFDRLSNKPINIFELGIGSNNLDIKNNMGSDATIGASLFGWSKYFSKAKIFAADIDQNCMIKTDRITTYQVDSTNIDSVRTLLSKLPELDIIIDDGLHEFESNYLFFTESIKLLKSGGIYVIEDILDSQLNLFIDFLNQIDNVNFKQLINIPISTPSCDNNILIVIK